MTHPEPAPDARQPSVMQPGSYDAVRLADAVEGILPALRALADGATPRLTRSVAMYADAPPPWAEQDECMFAVRMIAADSDLEDEFLDLDELQRAAEGLVTLLESWMIRAGDDAYRWRPNGEDE